MKHVKAFLFLIITVFACNSNKQEKPKQDVVLDSPSIVARPDTKPDTIPSNEHFRNIRVQRSGSDSFTISGEARVFEAAFSWIVEDGHNELSQGHEMTDAGAPEWGKFSFGVKAKKVRENSVVTLVLYEASAKDGSRQFILPVKLY